MLLLPLGDARSAAIIYNTGVCINVSAYFRLLLDSRAKQGCFWGMDVMKEGLNVAKVHIPHAVCGV